MKRIKEWDPDTPVVLACRPGLGEFFLKSGLADEIIVIDKKDKKQSAESMRTLAAREWDVVFVPHQSPRTAFMMARLRARHKVSFAQWWNRFFYDKRVVKPMDFPDALRQIALLTPFDSRLAEHFAQAEVQELRNPQDKKALEDFRRFAIPEWASMKIMSPQPEGRKVFIAPGSTWNTKRWTARGYSELARMILSAGFAVELVGSRAERPLCDTIEAAVGPKLTNRAGETSLNELVHTLRTGTALITNDSGSMHAAALSGLPTVAIFGPTTLDLGFRPWNDQAVVVQLDLNCRPCGKHGHDKCPLGHHHCMEKIDAATVFHAFRSLVTQ